MTSLLNVPGSRTVLIDVPANSTVTLNLPSNNRWFAVSCGLTVNTGGLAFVVACISNGGVRITTISTAQELAVDSAANNTLTLTNSNAYATSVLFISFYGNLPTVVT